MSSLSHMKKVFYSWRYVIKRNSLKVQRSRRANEFYLSKMKNKYFKSFEIYKKLRLMKYYSIEMAANLRLRRMFEVFMLGIKILLVRRHKNTISLKKYADIVSIDLNMLLSYYSRTIHQRWKCIFSRRTIDPLSGPLWKVK